MTTVHKYKQVCKAIDTNTLQILNSPHVDPHIEINLLNINESKVQQFVSIHSQNKDQTLHYLDIKLPNEYIQYEDDSTAYYTVKDWYENRYMLPFFKSKLFHFLNSSLIHEHNLIISYWIRLLNIANNFENGIIDIIILYLNHNNENAPRINFAIFNKILLNQLNGMEINVLKTNQNLFFNVFKYYIYSINNININYIHQITITTQYWKQEQFEEINDSVTLYANGYYKYCETDEIACNIECNVHSGLWNWNYDEYKNNKIEIYLVGYGYKCNMEELDLNAFSETDCDEFVNRNFRFDKLLQLKPAVDAEDNDFFQTVNIYYT
eukprot:415397_1